jgi:hypothetical protein
VVREREKRERQEREKHTKKEKEMKVSFLLSFIFLYIACCFAEDGLLPGPGGFFHPDCHVGMQKYLFTNKNNNHKIYSHFLFLLLTSYFLLLTSYFLFLISYFLFLTSIFYFLFSIFYFLFSIFYFLFF